MLKSLESDVNNNIIAYWRPKQLLAAGAEISFAYRQFWCKLPPERPPLAMVELSRSGRGWSAKHRRFLVEFAGEIFRQSKNKDDFKPRLNVSPGSIAFIRTFMSPDQATYRVLFEIDPGSETYSELRLVIEAEGKPISETWIYRWTA